MAINKINRLRFYAQKILPLSYDNSLTYLEWLEKVVATCNEVVTTVNGVIDIVEGVESDVAEIQTQVTGILASIGGIQTHLTSIDSSIGSLNGRVSNVETAIVSIQGDVSSLRANLNSLVVRVDSLSATVTGHSSAIGVLERNVSDITDNISDIEDDITAIQSSITTLNTRLTTALNTITEHTSQISDLERSVENIHRDVSGLTDVALKNANYANDVIDFGFKNLLDVDTFNGGSIGNTQTSNGVTVVYLGGGVYKAYGTATAQTVIVLGTMSYNEKLSGAKFNGLPNDADSGVFMSVREPWVSAYDTYLGTAHDYNTIGEFPTDTFSAVNVALQVGSYVNLGDGTDTYLTIKPMVINNDFPTGSPYFRDPSYIQFEPFVPTMLDVRESVKSVEDDISTLETTVSAHGSQIQILHDTDTTFSNLFGKNARYNNDVINRYSKNLIDVEGYAEDKIEADPTWETRTENGISVLYLGAGVYKVWGTSTARTIFPLYETLDITGVPSDADARVFMSVRQYGVSDYDTYYGTANTASAMGVLPETVSGSAYMALQIGQYVYMGDGFDEYVEIKPMVINPNFPSSRLTNEYKEFAPYTRPLNEISDLAIAAFYNTQNLSENVEDLQTDVATLQNEPKLPTVTNADNGKILGVANGVWGAINATSPVHIVNANITGSFDVSGSSMNMSFPDYSNLSQACTAIQNWLNAGEMVILHVKMTTGSGSFEDLYVPYTTHVQYSNYFMTSYLSSSNAPLYAKAYVSTYMGGSANIQIISPST